MLYDKLYSYKDYSKETDFVKDIYFSNSIKNQPNRPKLIDLACGTGSHLQHFESWADTTGLDINRGMLSIAKQKCPTSKIISGDITHLERLHMYYNQFDIVTCLFSSIQYIIDSNKLLEAFKQINKLLTSTGIIVLDLRYTSENWVNGHTITSTYKDSEYEIAMFGESYLEGVIAKWQPAIFWKNANEMNFTVDDVHTIRVYSVSEIESLLKQAGFKVKIYSNFNKIKYRNVNCPVFLGEKK